MNVQRRDWLHYDGEPPLTRHSRRTGSNSLRHKTHIPHILVRAIRVWEEETRGSRAPQKRTNALGRRNMIENLHRFTAMVCVIMACAANNARTASGAAVAAAAAA